MLRREGGFTDSLEEQIRTNTGGGGDVIQHKKRMFSTRGSF